LWLLRGFVSRRQGGLPEESINSFLLIYGVYFLLRIKTIVYFLLRIKTIFRLCSESNNVWPEGSDSKAYRSVEVTPNLTYSTSLNSVGVQLNFV
jgi:hypothetical protein